jgi:ketosteroid isomerase-like protein
LVSRKTASFDRSPADSSVSSKEQIVYRYFRLISRRDFQGLLELFDENAIINEPFSKETKGLYGKTDIENFLKVVVMANADLITRTIEFKNISEDSITALVVYERGNAINGQFTFNFELTESGRKIKRLRISFP